MEIQTRTTCDAPTCDACLNEKKEGHTGTITKYISCDLMQFGDYDSSCAIERANVRYLGEQNLIAYLETGFYGWNKAWILDTPDNLEMINALEDYPCFDDELVSLIEMEIEDEYIRDNDDIWSEYTPEPLREILQDNDLTDIIPEIYYRAKESCNMYFEVEAGGTGYIDLERLAPEYNLLLCDKYPWIKTISELQEKLDAITLPAFPEVYYRDSRDMLDHARLSERERNLLLYCEELEDIINSVRC